MRLCHVSRATLLPASDKTYSVLPRIEPVKYSQITFTWHTKGMGHALGYQAIN